MKLRISFVLLAAFGTTYSATSTDAQQQVFRRASKPLVAISGTDSSVNKPSYSRVTTADEWQQIWSRHLGTTVDDAYRAFMEIDFDRCMVIALFLGEKHQVRQVTIDSVTEKSNGMTVRYSQLFYGIALGENEKPPKPARPYAFVVLPTTNKDVVIEEMLWDKEAQARGLKPKWEERARLNANHDSSSAPQTRPK